VRKKPEFAGPGRAPMIADVGPLAQRLYALRRAGRLDRPCPILIGLAGGLPGNCRTGR
jgi:hypothetical protein